MSPQMFCSTKTENGKSGKKLTDRYKTSQCDYLHWDSYFSDIKIMQMLNIVIYIWYAPVS